LTPPLSLQTQGTKNMNIIKLTAAIALGLSSPANAAEPDWTLIHISDSGARVYYRTEDVMAGRSTTRAGRLWMWYDFARDATIATREVKQLNEVDCVAQTYRVLSATFYMPSGKNFTESTPYASKQYVIPGSVFASAIDAFCVDPAP
jgi:hypothetical protein